MKHTHPFKNILPALILALALTGLFQASPVPALAESERLLLLSVQQETPLAVTDLLRLIWERTEVTHERR